MKPKTVVLAAMLAVFLLPACPVLAQQSVAPITLPRMQVLDSNGKPLAGGCLFTYAAGTSTPQATYSDSPGTIQNTNPVLLDSAGAAVIYWTALPYKIIAKSAGGVNCALGPQQWSVDNVTTPVLSAKSLQGKLLDVSVGTATAGQVLTVNPAASAWTAQSKPVFDIRDFGCVEDGSTDNTGCMQAAISAAIAATAMGAGDAQTATVLCPDQPGPANTYYSIAKPLVLHGGNVRFAGNGRGSCLLTAFYRGPMFAVGPSTGSAFHDAASNIAVASPTPFATNVKSFHIDTTDGNGPYWFSLSDSSALSVLNGLTTFSVDFWTYLTAWPNNAALLCAKTNTDDDATTGPVPLCIYQIGIGGMEVRVRINGTDQRAATAALPSLNAWHHIAVTYDGTTLRAFVDGVVGATTYGGGGALTIPRRTWVVTNCAPGPTFDNGCSGATSPTGYMSALRFSNTARWTANFTPPARVNPVADANTLLLCNFDNQYDIFTGCTEGGSSTISWLPIHRQVNATVGNVEVSNVSFNGKGNADGMWIYGATDSRFDNLEMTQVRRGMVFHSDTLTYQNYSHGVEILTNGPASGYDTFGILGVGAANGITTFSKPHVIAAAFPFYWETGSVKFEQPESTPNAATVTNFGFDGSATSQMTVVMNAPQVDNEAGITNYVSDLTLRNVSSFTSTGGTFGGFANAVPLFNIVGASGGAYTFINPTFIQANTAPSIFHIINNPSQPITIVNPTLLGGITAVPFVDVAKQAIAIGNPGSTTNLAYSLDKAGKVTATGVSVAKIWRDCRADGVVADGVADDSAAANLCRTNALANGQNTLLFPSGTILIRAAALNWTNFPSLHIIGGGENQNTLFATWPHMTQFICDTAAATNVCADLTGSGKVTMEHVSFLSQTSQAHPSTVAVVMGRDNAAGGGNGLYCFAENNYFFDVSVMMDHMPAANGGGGSIAFYNVGAERPTFVNSGTTADLGFFMSPSNDFSITSPYQTLQTGCPSSMTQPVFINTYSQVIGTGPGMDIRGVAGGIIKNHNFVGTSASSGGNAMLFQGAANSNWDVTATSEEFNGGAGSGAGSIATTVNLDHSKFDMTFAGLTGGAVQGFFWYLANNLTMSDVDFRVRSVLNGSSNSQVISNNGTGETWKGGSIELSGTASPLNASNTTLVGTRVVAYDHTAANVTFNAASTYPLVASDVVGFVGSPFKFSGTVNAAAYQVAGVALAAANLSDGVTGSGAVVLADSPVFTTKTTQQTANGGQWIQGQASELLTLSTSGTTTDTSGNLLPANSIIEAVEARVTTTITTATDWKLGDATISGRFSGANATMTAGTTQVGTVQADQTGTSGPRQVSAAKVRVTTTGTPGAGAIRITVFYRQFVPPTS